MLRQRLRTRTVTLRAVGRLLVGLLALAFIWYGFCLILLAAKVSPSTVNDLSGYRTIYDTLAGLTPADADGTVRAITAGAGVLGLLVFGYLAFHELPRTYLARHDLMVTADEHGVIAVEPRAIERLAAIAAGRVPGVTGAASRYEVDELVVTVSVRRAREVAQTLRTAHGEVREALERHGLPQMPVTLTMTGFDGKQRRELA